MYFYFIVIAAMDLLLLYDKFVSASDRRVMSNDGSVWVLLHHLPPSRASTCRCSHMACVNSR